MHSARKKQKGDAAVDRANLEHIARLCNDGASSTSLASHLSLQQQRKCTKEKIRDEESGSLHLHPAAASIASRGCLPTSPERGFKRKVGCIHAPTQTGRKRKLTKDYDLGAPVPGNSIIFYQCSNKIPWKIS